jgi:hypothetical protein
MYKDNFYNTLKSAEIVLDKNVFATVRPNRSIPRDLLVEWAFRTQEKGDTVVECGKTKDVCKSLA